MSGDYEGARAPRYASDAEMALRGGDARDDWDGANRRTPPPPSAWERINRLSIIMTIIVSAAAVGGGLGIFFNNPFEMHAAAQTINAHQDAEIGELKSSHKALGDQFEGFQRGQNMQLEITMQQEIERLTAKLRDRPGDDELVRQRLTAIQNCEEVKSRLGRSSASCVTR